jgi:hypothetical protein
MSRALDRMPVEELRERRRRWPQSGLRYQRAWWMKRLLNADSGYYVYRAGKYIGSVIRYGRNWFAAAPDPEGRYLLGKGGDFLRFRDRDTATLALAMHQEGMPL